MKPEVRTTSAVIVHTTKVSANTSKIPHIPCFTGSLTSELLWTITDEPSPASFENTPLLQPCVMTSLMAMPATAPATGLMPSANLKMAANAAGTELM